MTNQKVASIGHNQAVAKKLHKLLSDSYTLLLLTQNVHWNIEGENFYSVHKLTDDIYNEQFAAIDVIAERLRALGQKVDATLTGFEKESTIKQKADVKGLVAAQEEIAAVCRELIDFADEQGDKGTADLATARVREHDKNAWMLRSLTK